MISSVLVRSLRCLFVVWALASVESALASIDSAIVFNEVQYHPAGNGPSYIELHSLSGVNVEVSGWQITGGVSYTFPAGTVVPGHGYLVVADTPGAITGALGPYSGALSHSGATLDLINKNGRVMDELTYGDSGVWPVGPDGSGSSLVKLNEESADAAAGNWTASPSANGTPGSTNFPQPGQEPTVTTLLALANTWKYRTDNVAPPAGWTALSFDDSAWPSGAALLYAGSPNISGAGDGLYGYWPLDETSGKTAANAVAGGPAASLLGGAAFTANASRGQVLSLPGTGGSYATAGTLPLMTLQNDFTWSFWANSTDSGGSNIVIGNRNNAAGDSTMPYDFVKFTPSSFEYWDNGNSNILSYSSSFPVGSWVHHAVVKKGSLLTYYRNGVAGGTRTITAAANLIQPFNLGGGAGGENWHGLLDDVALWTKALPASSISGLATGSLTPLTAPTGSSTVGLATPLTAGPSAHYFRSTFAFNGAKSRTALSLQYVLDDGAVFYLNGVEVLRVNMPAGPISHSTLASTNITGSNLITVSIPSDALVPGTNELAVEVHQFSTSSPNSDMVFGAALTGSETPPPLRYPGSGVVFNEFGPAGSGFQLELLNNSSEAIDLAGYQIVSSAGSSFSLPAQTLPAGGLASFTAAQLGFAPVDGDKLFLFEADGTSFDDAEKVSKKLRGRSADGRWLFPSVSTFGAANSFSFNSDVVIDEIMYKPATAQAAQEKWVELYNRGPAAVNLSGWQFSDAAAYTFPANTTLAPGGYLVIASDVAAFAQHHPGVTPLGPFTGKLSAKNNHLELDDSTGNPVDELRFYGGGRWPAAAAGGGSSLERRDPHAATAAAENWAASNEAGRVSWQTFSWSGTGAVHNGDPTKWNEFVCGVLDNGTFLLDDVSVKDVTAGNVELIQNGTFESGAASWRFLGTHQQATVVQDPSGTGKVLQVVATGATEHMHNHLETTLKSGSSFATLNASHTYTISFRARWVSGSNLLNARLYFNRLANTCVLPVSPAGGTPGAANFVGISNLGPTYSALSHSPAVPAAGQATTVSAVAADPDGIASMSLLYTLDGGGSFVSTPMTLLNGVYAAAIPGQDAGAKAQFYVQAVDTAGAKSYFPQEGAASRAMAVWDDGQAALAIGTVKPYNIRILMPDADVTTLHTVTNVMSNSPMPCTVIVNESQAIYNCGVRLKGSERGRDQDSRVSFNVSFPLDQLFLGAHKDIDLDRSGPVEIMIKHALTVAGGLPGSEDDLGRVIAPESKHTGPVLITKERYDSPYLDNQFPNGSDGSLYKYELIYYPTTTAGAGTVEDLKIPEPDGVVGVGMQDLGGTNKELYRWHWLQEDNSDLDLYSGLATWLAAFGRTNDAQYYSDAANQMDVSEWLRVFAVEDLFGITDNYGGDGSQHNTMVYQRTTDNRWMLFPHDMDYTFSYGANAPFPYSGQGDAAKLIATSTATGIGNRHTYYAHLLNLCTNVFNSSYLGPWAQHYSQFLSQDLTGYMSYVDSRNGAALSAISAAVPQVSFAITTNNGQPLTVSTNTVTLQGTGWVDMNSILIAGNPVAVPIVWLTGNTWQITIPVAHGTQTITLQGVGVDGSIVGTSTITVTSTANTVWPAIKINEWLASNDTFLDPADAKAEDWLELYNPTSSVVSLANWVLANGTTTLAIPSGYTIPANGFLLVWCDKLTGSNNGVAPLHAPFKLSADGATLVLSAPDAQVIDTITYGPQITDLSEGRFPDGGAKISALTYPSPQSANILTVPTLSADGEIVTVTFATVSGVHYQAQSSEDLLNWQALGSVQTGTGNPIAIPDHTGSSSRRFYRILVQP